MNFGHHLLNRATFEHIDAKVRARPPRKPPLRELDARYTRFEKDAELELALQAATVL